MLILHERTFQAQKNKKTPLFLPKLDKTKKKIYPEKIYFRGKLSFLVLILKIILYFLKRKLFSYFRKQKAQKNFLYFLKRKLFLYFPKWKPRTDFLYFSKRNFLIFQELEILKKLLIFKEVTSRA